ncbi:MAG: enoyl-CoA hydratase-related protein [Litorimonas sp.]
MTDKPEGVGTLVQYEREGNIAIVTLNRPEKRNAVSPELAAALDWVVKDVEADDDIWVAILTSSNDKTFCAGADLKAISEGKGHLLSTKDGGFAGYVSAPRKKPWIAAVKGSALAGGMELTLASDMVVADETARFGLPEVKRSLVAAAGGVHRLARRIPQAIAMEMVATGDPIDAGTAHRHGLVNRIVPLDQVMDEARSLARQITANAPIAVRESLSVTRRAFDATDEVLMNEGQHAFGRVAQTEDMQEGPRAFLEKRAPQWKGR